MKLSKRLGMRVMALADLPACNCQRCKMMPEMMKLLRGVIESGLRGIGRMQRDILGALSATLPVEAATLAAFTHPSAH